MAQTPSPQTPPPGEMVRFADNALVQVLFGQYDTHLQRLEEALGVTIHPRGNAVAIAGEPLACARARRVLEELYALLERGEAVDLSRVNDALRAVAEDTSLTTLVSDSGALRTPRRIIHPRSKRQAGYIETLKNHAITIAIGPAGTGKTYLGVAMAVAGFLEGRYERIILTRPAVEAGERLGFLPGDLQAKVDPYLRPLYDALYEMLGFDKVDRMLEQRELEIAPLAYMRGRTLNDAFIILDEAQNTTPEQMKMFLTRLGESSRAVVAGDVTQVDLPRGQESGLIQALSILDGVEGIGVARFQAADVVRHPLVQRIVEAYERHERNGMEPPTGKRKGAGKSRHRSGS